MVAEGMVRSRDRREYRPIHLLQIAVGSGVGMGLEDYAVPKCGYYGN